MVLGKKVTTTNGADNNTQVEQCSSGQKTEKMRKDESKREGRRETKSSQDTKTSI